MKQPAWVREVVARQRQQMRNLDNGPVMSMPMQQRAPGWLLLKTEISCIPDAAYPWNPEVVKAIQGITKDIVPIWIKRVYRSPYDEAQQEEVVIGRHGLGQRTYYSPVIPFSCPMPSGYSFTKPNSIYWEPWGEADKRARDLPGAYVPFDWRFYKHVKNNFKDFDLKAYKEQIMQQLYEHEQGQQKNKDEMARMRAELDKYVSRKLETCSETEMKEFFLGKFYKKSQS